MAESVKIRGSYGVNVVGHLTDGTGLGEAARSHVRALAAAKVPFSLRDFPHPRVHNKVREFRRFSKRNPHFLNLVELNFNRDFEFQEAAGPGFFLRKRNVGYWVWEFEEFPEERLKNFGLYDEIWTPTRFLQNAFERVSPIPVFRMPYSVIAPCPSGDVRSVRARLNIPQNAFVFLFMFSYGSNPERKNPIAVLRAFQKAFRRNERAVLLLKGNQAHFRSDAEKQLLSQADDVRVRIWSEDLSAQGVADLLKAADCYVSLHRAEGFGLPIAEAMALGKPAIATGYSGNLDFMTEANSLLVRYKKVPLSEDSRPYKKGWFWAEPDIDHAAALMKRVFRDPGLAQTLGRRAKHTMAAAYSPAVVGRLLQDRLNQIETRKKRSA